MSPNNFKTGDVSSQTILANENTVIKFNTQGVTDRVSITDMNGNNISYRQFNGEFKDEQSFRFTNAYESNRFLKEEQQFIITITGGASSSPCGRTTGWEFDVTNFGWLIGNSRNFFCPNRDDDEFRRSGQ